MKILFVGGSFDNEGGRASSLVEKFSKELKNTAGDICVDIKNGGNFNEIEAILESTINYDSVFWWPNIPNDYPKIRNVKEVNFKTLLITSKRNDDEKYSFGELINRSLEVKANLTVEFKKIGDVFSFLLFDPIGNSWYEGESVEECAKSIISRIKFLVSITRTKSVNISTDSLEVPDEKDFFSFVRESAEIFHRIIRPDKTVTRFLGNSSFRCQRGFPSFKKDGIVFVSRRNIDKRYISKENFVPTYLKDGVVYYYGENKPSVDTPIQLRLYELFPNINYMLHTHCYAKSVTFTKTPIPCGAIEEVDEIKKVTKDYNLDFYIINLIGHGCLIMSNNVENFKKVEFYGREMPEKMFKKI